MLNIGEDVNGRQRGCVLDDSSLAANDALRLARHNFCVEKSQGKRDLGCM